MHSHPGVNMEECGAWTGELIFQGSSVFVSHTCTQTQTELWITDMEASQFDNKALQWTQWHHRGVVMHTHNVHCWLPVSGNQDIAFVKNTVVELIVDVQTPKPRDFICDLVKRWEWPRIVHQVDDNNNKVLRQYCYMNVFSQHFLCPSSHHISPAGALFCWTDGEMVKLSSLTF